MWFTVFLQWLPALLCSDICSMALQEHILYDSVPPNTIRANIVAFASYKISFKSLIKLPVLHHFHFILLCISIFSKHLCHCLLVLGTRQPFISTMSFGSFTSIHCVLKWIYMWSVGVLNSSCWHAFSECWALFTRFPNIVEGTISIIFTVLPCKSRAKRYIVPLPP